MLIAPRKEGLTHTKCLVEREHMPLVTQLPGLKRFTTAAPLDPDQIDYPLGSNAVWDDVLVQLPFESLDDLREAFESGIGRHGRDAVNFVDVGDSVSIPIGGETLQYRGLPANL